MATENMVNIPLSSDEENAVKNTEINSGLQNKPELCDGLGKLLCFLYFVLNMFIVHIYKY